MSEQGLSGLYFDGRRSAGHAARLRLDDGFLVLRLKQGEQRFPARRARLGTQVGSASSYLWLDGTAIFESADQAGLAALAKAASGSVGSGLLHRLETNWRLILFSAVVVAVFLIGSLRWGVPWLAGSVARAVPTQLEQWVGNQSLAALDEHWLEPTGLHAERQTALRAAFNPYIASLQRAYPQYPWRLELRSSAAIGANALALPGGVLVLTDDLVRLARDDQELAAILAHEAGHVVHRHGMRGIVQSSLALWLMMSITGDLSAASDLTTGLPAILANLGYSRAMETEADDFALQQLVQQGIDPIRFADIMRRLDAIHGASKTGKFGEFLSTHPPTADRIRRFIDASKGTR